MPGTPSKAAAAVLLLLVLGACGREDPAPPDQPKPKPKPKPELARAPSAGPPPAADVQAGPSAESGNAAATLRRYYDLIERRRYADAYALREEDRADLEAFSAHFDRMASQKVTVGTASEPVAERGWLYVEVPVQSYGTMADGTPSASAGTVTLRRRVDGGTWRIYSK